jgi:hypothetical protein
VRRNSFLAAAALVAGVALVILAVRAGRSTKKARLDTQGWTLDRAIDEAADYLSRADAADGRFEYRLFTDGRHGNPQRYNIVRHAGAIYALADYTTQAKNPDLRTKAGATATRATTYLLSRYVHPPRAFPDQQAVWSDPKEEGGGPHPYVKLGAVGLSLIGLMNELRAADAPGAIALSEEARADQLAKGQGMGRFIQNTMKPAGDFKGKYDDDRGYVGDSESLYYPGEAILGLTMLFERDHDVRWLETGVRAINYLVQSRKRGKSRLPNDHWLMIAIDRMLPYYGQLREPPLPAEEVLQHSVDIGRTMIEDMENTHAREPDDPDLEGSFDPGGRTTPNATRLEGLLALEHALEGQAKYADFVPPLRATISKGIAFLRRSQVKDGVARGGQPAAILAVPEGPDGGGDDEEHPPGGGAEREVRIDYVQHAMSAMMRYRAMCSSGGVGCEQMP